MHGHSMTEEKDVSHLMKLIDENLRRVYREDDTQKEDVPDRFKQLLDRLKEQETKNDR